MIPFVEPWLPETCADAVRQQVLSGWVGPGPATRAFAAELAAHAGVGHCLLTVSGTVALTLAAQALGLRAGDEVLVPAYGVISTINAFAAAGLAPRLVDIDPVTGCLDPRRLAETLSPATRAVCFVNFSGRTAAELVETAKLCAAAGVPLIEDAACALGQRHRGRAAGSFGTVGVYSFSVPKIVTTGQGGALITAQEEIWERAAAYIDQGDLEWRRTHLNRSVGTNLRFTDVQAALGLVQLRDLEARQARRRAAFAVLRDGLEERLWALPDGEPPLHNVVFTGEPERLVASLRERGVGAVRQYRTLCQHPAYRHLGSERRFAGADFWTDHAVYLPFGLTLTAPAAKRVVEALDATGVALLPASSAAVL